MKDSVMSWRNAIIAPTGICVWGWILVILTAQTGGRARFRLRAAERRNVNSAMKMIVKVNAIATTAVNDEEL